MKPLTEEQAKKAVRAYFRWYAEENGRESNPETVRLRKGQRWDIGNGWTFPMVYGHRPVWVREVENGWVVVQRAEMPEATFTREEFL